MRKYEDVKWMNKYNQRGTAVMSKTTKTLLIGVFIGAIMPLAIDFALFGTVKPCETVTRYEDGSSIIKCSVKG